MKLNAVDELLQAHIVAPFETPLRISRDLRGPLRLRSGEVLCTGFSDVCEVLGGVSFARSAALTPTTACAASRTDIEWSVHRSGHKHGQYRRSILAAAKMTDPTNKLRAILSSTIPSKDGSEIDVRNDLVEKSLHCLICDTLGLSLADTKEMSKLLEAIDPRFSTWRPAASVVTAAAVSRATLTALIARTSGMVPELVPMAADLAYGVRHLISSVVCSALHLAGAQLLPDRIAALDDEALALVIAETCRIASPTVVTPRTCVRNVTVGEFMFKAGDEVCCYIPGALHDPAVFDASEEFQPRRRGPEDILAFGFGKHRCPFAAFSTSAAATILRFLGERGFEVVPHRERQWRRSTNSFGPEGVRVTSAGHSRQSAVARAAKLLST